MREPKGRKEEMLSSLQAKSPLEVWIKIHAHLLNGDIRHGSISSEFLHEKMSLRASLKLQKETILWAIEQGLLKSHPEDIPTSYTLTEKGRAWNAN
jgi:hypothetical protein